MPNKQKAKTNITTELATATTNTHKAPQPHILVTTFKSDTITFRRGIVLVYFD